MRIGNFKAAGAVALGILACLQNGANASPIPHEESALDPMNGKLPGREIETGAAHLLKRDDPLANLENCIRENGIEKLGNCAQNFLNDEVSTLVGNLENNMEAKIKKDMQDALQEGGNIIQSKMKAGVDGIAALLAAHLAVLIGKDVLSSKPVRKKFGQLKNHVCGVSHTDDSDIMEKGQNLEEKLPNLSPPSRSSSGNTAVDSTVITTSNDPRQRVSVDGRYPVVAVNTPVSRV